MIEVNAENVIDYLLTTGSSVAESVGTPPDELKHAQAAELAWGVSNIVLRIDTPERSFVVKQSRKQLRTQIDWFSQLERIWRETDALRALQRLLPAGAAPRVLAENRNNYLFVMEAIEADHRVWKAELLAGNFDVEIARKLAGHLAVIHRGSTGDVLIAEQLADRDIFDELRLDPFYRYVAERNSLLQAPLLSLIEDTLARRDCLVLADFSPKNILLTSGDPVLVDFETAHVGDPAFDLGFFLSHLLLKAVFHHQRLAQVMELPRVFWLEYVSRLGDSPAPEWLIDPARSPGFERQCVRHLGACMLARIDGKSCVDYLTAAWQPELVRRYCHRLLCEPLASMPDAFDLLIDELGRST